MPFQIQGSLLWQASHWDTRSSCLRTPFISPCSPDQSSQNDLGSPSALLQGCSWTAKLKSKHESCHSEGIRWGKVKWKLTQILSLTFKHRTQVTNWRAQASSWVHRKNNSLEKIILRASSTTHLLFSLTTERTQTLNFGILHKHQKLGGMNWCDPNGRHCLKSVAFVEKHGGNYELSCKNHLTSSTASRWGG